MITAPEDLYAMFSTGTQAAMVSKKVYAFNDEGGMAMVLDEKRGTLVGVVGIADLEFLGLEFRSTALAPAVAPLVDGDQLVAEELAEDQGFAVDEAPRQ